MLIKKGVFLKGIQSEILVAIMIADCVCSELQLNFVITSVLDGVHKQGSKHYIGQAFDMRIRNFSSSQITVLVARLKECLGSNFDVVLETDHIHIEFDPL